MRGFLRATFADGLGARGATGIRAGSLFLAYFSLALALSCVELQLDDKYDNFSG